jgi:hypothetical protein
VRSRGAEALVRARSLLERNLFRDPPTEALGPWAWLALIGAFTGAIAIQLLRMWSSRPLDSLFIEDGAVWLTGALEREPLDAIFTPYNGYIQVLSRVVAEPIAELPVEAWAAAMAISGAAIVAACACLVWRASAGYIDSRPLRAALSAMVILLPVVGWESLATVTNSIWFLLYVCAWALLWRPAGWTEAGVAAVVVLMAALSNLGVVFLLPLWALRAIVVRDRRDVLIVSAFAIGVALQLGFSAGEIGLHGEPDDPVRVRDTTFGACVPFSTSPCWSWDLVAAYPQRIVGGVAAGQQVNGELWKAFGVPLLIVYTLGLMALVWRSRRDPRTRILVPLLVVISAALFVVSGYERWGVGGNQFLWPTGEYTPGLHYMIAPALLLLAAAVLHLDSLLRSAGKSPARTFRFGVAAGVVVFAVVSTALAFPVGDFAARGRESWTDSVAAAKAECLRHGAANTVSISTPFSAFDFRVVVPCQRLR